MMGLALGAGAAQGLARGLAGRLSDRGAAVPPALVLVLVALGLVAKGQVGAGDAEPLPVFEVFEVFRFE